MKNNPENRTPPPPKKPLQKQKKTSMSYVNITCFPRYNITESF